MSKIVDKEAKALAEAQSAATKEIADEIINKLFLAEQAWKTPDDYGKVVEIVRGIKDEHRHVYKILLALTSTDVVRKIIASLG